MNTAVSFRNVDIMFGRNPAEALAMLDAGASRSEILAKTGNVLGAAGANLDISEGQISVLMGLSGSGKPTLLRGVNGLNRVTRGSILVRHAGQDVDVVSCKADTLRQMRQKTVAMVFQQFALLPWRTVADNVGLGLEFSGVPEPERKERVARQLVLVGLDQWADKHAHELSGGMQQRVGLARAFATEAPILLMDEPFSALDPLIRTKLQDELLELQTKLRKTIIFVSHDLEEALKIGNCITIMEGGRIVQSGPPEEIVLKPADDYVREFIANVNPLSVLTAWNVMDPLADLDQDKDGWVWLDKAHTTRMQLNSDRRRIATERNGMTGVCVSCDDLDADLPLNAKPVYWACPGTSLKIVMMAIHSTNVAPVAFFDDEDRFMGSIGVKNVLRAILKR